MTFACDFLKVPFASHERKDNILQSHEKLNRSTAQPLNRSTAQPLNRSTAQPLNRSISGIALAVPKSPAAGQSALWKYKAIYRQGDDRVGQWSDVVSIPLAG